MGKMSSVDVARLVLEYIKVLLWPMVVVVAILWLGRANLPDLIRRIKLLEVPGGKVEFTEAEREAVTTVNELAESTGRRFTMHLGSHYFRESLKLSAPAGLSHTDVHAYSPLDPAEKTLQQLHLDLTVLVSELEGMLDMRPTYHRPGDHADLAQRIRDLVVQTEVYGWPNLADSYTTVVKVAGEQTDDQARRQPLVAFLAQQVSNSARGLFDESMERVGLRLREQEARERQDAIAEPPRRAPIKKAAKKAVRRLQSPAEPGTPKSDANQSS